MSSSKYGPKVKQQFIRLKSKSKSITVDCHDLAIGENGNIYLLGSVTPFVYCFDKDGSLLLKWKIVTEHDAVRGGRVNRYHVCKFAIGLYGNVDNRVLKGLNAIRTLSQFPPGLLSMCASYVGIEYIYVIEQSYDRISIFDTYGNFVRSWGSRGQDIGQLNKPKDCCVTKDGHLYVCDYLNNRIQVFGDKETVRTIAGIKHPNCIAVNGDKQEIWVGCLPGELKCLSTVNGQITKTIQASCTIGSKHSVAVDSNGFIYLSDYRGIAVYVHSDYSARRISMLSRDPEPEPMILTSYNGCIYGTNKISNYITLFSLDTKLQT